MEVITTHNSTDFDALASLIAAKILYPEAVSLLPSRVNPNVRAFLSLHKDMELFNFYPVEKVDGREVSRLVVVDANRWQRLDRLKSLSGNKAMEIHVWDHHSEVSDMEAGLCREEKVGACTTLLVEEIKKRKADISPIQSTLFLAGIYEDTGSLSFPQTTARDALAVAHLLENSADLSVLENFLRPTYGPRQKDVLFNMLQEARRIKVNDFTISICKMEVEGHTHGLSLVVLMYRDILNVDAAFGIFTEQDKKRTIVIARSGVDTLDVGKIMRSMGGGGHPGAASAMLKNVNPDAVEEWILELVRGNQQSSVRVGDLMSFPVFSVHPDTTMEEVGALLKEKGVSGMPVAEDGNLLGVISRRDVNKLRSPSQWKSPVKAFMSRDVMTISPDKSVPAASRLLVKHDIGRLPVVRDGRIIGIFTRSDAMLYYYDLMPE